MGRSVSKQSLRNTVFRDIWGIMFKYSIVIALCLLSLAEAQRRGGRRRAFRRGRQDASAGYTAPDDVPVYAASDAVPTYEAAGDDALAALGNSIPGVPGEDYPIYAEVPESGFSCEGQVMEVTMLTLRPSVKHSIFAQLMELEVLPSTASSVLMEHSSTRTISSVIGGSTLTAPLLRIFTLSMMRLLLNVKLLLELPPMLQLNMEHLLRRNMQLLLIIQNMRQSLRLLMIMKL